MTEKKNVQEFDEQLLIQRAKDFWTKWGKFISTIGIIILLLAAGWYVYRNYVRLPKEKKALELMFKAEEYYRKDSVSKALNGDGLHWGFIKIIRQYGGTKAGKLAHFYAGSCYIKLNENEKALKYLKKFRSKSKPAQARAWKLMADAYADLGKHKEALEYYQKAARKFPKEETFSADCLFLGAYLAHKTLNDTKTAIKLYKELKEKYPRTQPGMDADNYLAQLGVYNSDE